MTAEQKTELRRLIRVYGHRRSEQQVWETAHAAAQFVPFLQQEVEKAKTATTQAWDEINNMLATL